MIKFSGKVWRILFSARAGVPLAPARAPVGRFHHSGQPAIYTSLTPEGCAIAIRRYVAPGDAPRILQPLHVTAGKIADFRGRADLSVVWQDIHASGAPSPTWAFSDTARTEGAQGLLYSSRSRPELTHLVLFDLTDATVQAGGPARHWEPPT